MPTADQVVVELLVKNGNFDARVKQSATAFGDGMKRIGQSAEKAERDVAKSTRAQRNEIKKLETEMRGSAGKIGGSFQALAASAATYFSGRELGGLVDEYTRLQNQLRVAGLEGEELKRVQDRLFESSQRYGVSINALAELFGKASQTAKELGATQGQLLKLTDATSQALLITGTSTQQASGAILGLTQALASGTVRAEEFNQINEGGLRPLLQAAAASDRFGGSVAKLRQAVIDGELSSREFYESILKNSKQIETQASKATLTLAAGFTSLRNALVVYFGEADKANGVSAALGNALGAVARNLDVLIPALAAVIVLVGVRYIASVAAATVSTIALGAAATGTAVQMGAMGAAAFALQARLAGAATTAEALSFALVGMKGSLATVAVIAMGAAIYYVATEMAGAKQATGAYAQAQAEAEAVTKRAADAAEKLAAAHGKARVEALALARAEAENIKQKLASARASVTLAKAELARANVRLLDRVEASQQSVMLTGQPGAFGAGLIEPGAKANQAKGNLAQSEKTVKSLEASLAKIEAAIVAGPPKISPAGVKADKTKAAKGSTGPSAEEIQQRFNDELTSLAQQTLSAQQSMALSAGERAELERRSVELAHVRAEAGIKADKDYTGAQKERLLSQLKTLAFEERARIDFEEKRRIEEEQRQTADERQNIERDQLALQLDLATTQRERKSIALQMLELEERHQRAILEGVIASETTAEAEKERARILLEGLEKSGSSRREKIKQDNASPIQQYLQDIPNTADEINEALENVAAGGLATFTDALTDAIVNFRSLGDVGRAVLQTITAGLVKMAIQQLILNTIGQTLGTAASAATGVQAAAAATAWAPAAALASLATLGANAGPAAVALATTNALALGLAATSAVAKKDGGPIFGPGGPRDDKVLMAASPGEYVIKARSAAKLGRGALDFLNATGEMPNAYADGGPIGRAFHPNNSSASSGRSGGGGIDEAALRRIESAVERGAASQMPVNLYPTFSPKSAMQAMLADPGAQRVMFDFFANNSGTMNARLRR